MERWRAHGKSDDLSAWVPEQPPASGRSRRHPCRAACLKPAYGTNRRHVRWRAAVNRDWHRGAPAAHVIVIWASRVQPRWPKERQLQNRRKAAPKKSKATEFLSGQDQTRDRTQETFGKAAPKTLAEVVAKTSAKWGKAPQKNPRLPSASSAKVTQTRPSRDRSRRDGRPRSLDSKAAKAKRQVTPSHTRRPRQPGPNVPTYPRQALCRPLQHAVQPCFGVGEIVELDQVPRLGSQVADPAACAMSAII